MGERKVTFPVIGTEHGETIRRNSETGVEIRSTKMDNGKSEHTVYAPGRDKMRLINYFETLSGAREEALDRAQDMREQISLSFDEAAAEADRREQADADAAPATEATSGLEVVFRPTFSHELTGIRFRIVTPQGRETVRFAAESEGGYAFVTLLTFVTSERSRSGLRAAYRTAKLGDLRTLEGGRVVSTATVPAAPEFTEHARKQFPSVVAMVEGKPLDAMTEAGFRTEAYGIGTVWTHTATGVRIGKFPGQAYAVSTPVNGAHVEVDEHHGEFRTLGDALAFGRGLVAVWSQRIAVEHAEALAQDEQRVEHDDVTGPDRCSACGSSDIEDEDYGIRCLSCGYVDEDGLTASDVDPVVAREAAEASGLDEAEVEQAVAEAAARQARKLPTTIVGHRDVVTFAPGATVVPETIEGATDVSPWTLDLTGEIMHAPGGRIFVYVWQSFTHPTKGPAGRLAPVWLDELRTPGGAARVTIAGI